MQYLTTFFFLGLLLLALFEREMIKDFVMQFSWLIKSFGLYWAGILAIIVLIEALPFLGLFIPGQQLFVLTLGFSHGEVLPAMILTGIAAMFVGNIVSYFLGRRYGDYFLTHFGPGFGIGKTERSYIERWFEKHGSWFLILWKFHNLTASIGALLAGSSGMSFMKFFIPNSFGIILWVGVMSIIGRLFAEHYEKIIDNISPTRKSVANEPTLYSNKKINKMVDFYYCNALIKHGTTNFLMFFTICYSKLL